MVTTYCQSVDVWRFLQFKRRFGGDDFSTETVPSKEDVDAFINRFEDFIDSETMHSWRAKTVTESFDIDYEDPIDNYFGDYYMRIKLTNRQIRALDDTQGDSLEVWDGSNYEQYLGSGSSRVEGRNRDYWLDLNEGFLFIATYQTYSQLAVRITYRFGDTTVPGFIKEACIKFVAAEILQSDDETVLLPEGTSNMTQQNKVDRWLERARFLVNTNKEFKLL